LGMEVLEDGAVFTKNGG